MKLTTIILTSIFFCTTNTFTSDTVDRLNKALYTNQVTKEQYDYFKSQIDFKRKINIESRIDSMATWDLDILYVEEVYYPKKDSFLVREYYFSTKKEQEFEKVEKDDNWTVYQPDRYYENGKLTNRYFFRHNESREHLFSIRQHMQTRKLIDKIDAIVKKEVVQAGCGISVRGKAKRMAKGKAEKKYKKPQTPNYYLTESLIDNNGLTISFQLPDKQKFKVIVEGLPF